MSCWQVLSSPRRPERSCWSSMLQGFCSPSWWHACSNVFSSMTKIYLSWWNFLLTACRQVNQLLFICGKKPSNICTRWGGSSWSLLSSSGSWDIFLVIRKTEMFLTNRSPKWNSLLYPQRRKRKLSPNWNVWNRWITNRNPISVASVKPYNRYSIRWVSTGRWASACWLVWLPKKLSSARWSSYIQESRTTAKSWPNDWNRIKMPRENRYLPLWSHWVSCSLFWSISLVSLRYRPLSTNPALGNGVYL